jgi:5-methylcytosine-specific restriction endonuclease McrA
MPAEPKSKPKKRSRRRKKSRKSTRRQLLTAWSLQVRERDHFRCQVCGSEQYTQAHHLLPKRFYPQFMLDPDCGITLCARHHSMSGLSAETNGLWFSEWMKRNRPWQHQWVLDRVAGDLLAVSRATPPTPEPAAQEIPAADPVPTEPGPPGG